MNGIQKQPGKIIKAVQATKRFFRNTLIAGIMTASVAAPIKALSTEPSYKMPVITNERSHVLSKENFSDEMKSLVPQMVTEGLFATEKDAYNALSNGNFAPTLKQILYTDNQALKDAFANKMFCSEITNFTDLQASFSIYDFDTTNAMSNWSFSWGEIIGLAVAPTRLNKRTLSAAQLYLANGDTVDNYSDTYTTRYTPKMVVSSSFVTKLGTDFATYDWAASYSPKNEDNIPASLRFQFTNVGKQWYISPLDYVMASKISGEKWLVDAGASVGVDFARAVVWAGNITGKPQFSYGLQVTPNALLSEDVNYYFMSTFYAMGRKQQNSATSWNKNIEVLAGARLDFNVGNLLILGGTVEYNSAAGNYYSVQKPTGLSAWLNASLFVDAF